MAPVVVGLWTSLPKDSLERGLRPGDDATDLGGEAGDEEDIVFNACVKGGGWGRGHNPEAIKLNDLGPRLAKEPGTHHIHPDAKTNYSCSVLLATRLWILFLQQASLEAEKN